VGGNTKGYNANLYRSATITQQLIMPPAAVKTIRNQIFWQYAKLIAKSAGLEVHDYVPAVGY
jgi:hypothetical protein